jgi:hypothetical protein
VSARASRVLVRASGVLAIAVLATAASACGGELATEELDAVAIEPVASSSSDADVEVPAGTAAGAEDPEPAQDDEAAPLTASEEPAEDSGVEEAGADTRLPDEPETDAAETETDAAEADEVVADAGPTDAAIARFVAATTRAAVDSYHRIGDVTGDGIRDVVVALVTVDGELEVVLGRWDGESVAESGRVQRSGATDVGVIVTRDVLEDGRFELLVPHQDRPRRGALLVTVSRHGQLEVPGACPIATPARHALDFGDGVVPVELACEKRDARGRDGLVWSDGVFLGVAAVGAQARGGGGG